MRTYRDSWGALPAAASVILLFGAHPSALAQTSVDRSFEPAPKDCADVRWSQRALDAFPSIADACQSVEQRNGITYVKFEGTVEAVKNGGKRISVDLQGADELTFHPTPRTTLYIDGERTEFADLEDGAKLNFYVPEDRLEAQLQPDPQRVAFVIFPIVIPGESAVSQQAMAELPATAGLLPTIGLAGALLIILGFAARVVRTRSSLR
jgi:hypothetical protein